MKLALKVTSALLVHDTKKGRKATSEKFRRTCTRLTLQHTTITSLLVSFRRVHNHRQKSPAEIHSGFAAPKLIKIFEISSCF